MDQRAAPTKKDLGPPPEISWYALIPTPPSEKPQGKRQPSCVFSPDGNIGAGIPIYSVDELGKICNRVLEKQDFLKRLDQLYLGSTRLKNSFFDAGNKKHHGPLLQECWKSLHHPDQHPPTITGIFSLIPKKQKGKKGRQLVDPEKDLVFGTGWKDGGNAPRIKFIFNCAGAYNTLETESVYGVREKLIETPHYFIGTARVVKDRDPKRQGHEMITLVLDLAKGFIHKGSLPVSIRNIVGVDMAAPAPSLPAPRIALVA